MTIKQVKSGWQVNIQPGGRGGQRVKKTFPTKAEALDWERQIRVKVKQQPDWSPPKKDARRLTDLVDLWFKHHGVGLKEGEGTRQRLITMSEAMGNPRAELFSAGMFAEYRSRRMDAGITANNMNREQAYMRAVFNELIRLDIWKRDNPLKKLRAFKIQEVELSYLTDDQIRLLFAAFDQSRNTHVRLISRVALETGARWSEAEGLRLAQVRDRRIQFAKTKSGKVRAVPISLELEAALNAHHREHGNGERIFAAAYSAFRDAIDRAQIVLPAGQLSHALRHTFASHFMMKGGNILALQRILGHSDLKMTMRYAHLAPEHLEQAVALNPLAGFDFKNPR